MAVAALCCALQAEAPPASDPLEGLWAGRMSWDAGPSGALTITRDRKDWVATLKGERAHFTPQGASIRFAFGHGGFRGTLSGSTIRGFWLQPHGSAGDPRDPDGKGSTFAASTTLTRGKDGTWHGTVAPLADTFTLYLKIFRTDDGRLTAAFRNPELNFRVGPAQMAVAHTGNDVTFTDPSDPKKQVKASFASQPDRLQMTLPNVGLGMTLTRATPELAKEFYLRPAGDLSYIYRAPADLRDGWHVARARDAGMDEVLLGKLIQDIAFTDPAAKRPGLIHSLLVAHGGKLVLEEYFAGYDGNTAHDTRSAAKTFTSVMLGVEMLRGVPLSAETKLYPLLTAKGPFANPDPRKNTITLAHLMTHNSGLACDDNDDNSPGGEEAVQSQRKTPDWWKYTLDLPMAHDPGTRYAYCSPGINLMGAALSAATHVWLPQLFDETVARPLQWGPYWWDLMPDGEGYLGGGVFVRPRDMLKLGQAYLDGGVWNGERIVSKAWVAESTALHAIISPQTTGLSGEDFGNSYFPGEDGYAWHLSTLHAQGRDYRAYGASGNGGQLLIVVPELDLVVGFTGGNYGQGLIWNAWRDKLIPERIIPAIVK
jgi:CubicO group peptidase (beta-lactamase class C family)